MLFTTINKTNKLNQQNIIEKINNIKKTKLNTSTKIKAHIKTDIYHKQAYVNKMKNIIDNNTTLIYDFTQYDIDEYKKNLMHTTFLIPFKNDVKERLENLEIIVNYLSKNFNTNIFIYEQHPDTCHFENLNLQYKTNIKYFFSKTDMQFSRTSITNYLIDQVNTKVIAINDVDCFTNIQSYIDSEQMIIDDKIDMIHPFGTPEGVIQVDADNKQKFIQSEYAVDALYNNIYKHPDKPDPAGVGGILFINIELYKEYGKENPYFISYSSEDIERIQRFRKLGFRTDESIDNKFIGPNDKYFNTPLYHLSHMRTEYSTIYHKYYISNEILNYCLKNISKKDLLEYYKYINNNNNT
jgi:hypothetical protein